jgi:glycosyltransferase involved in cell wall biosynthesis
MRKILIVAFHFPPQAGSSGMLRALKFCRNLPENGWEPVVLTASPRAYEKLDWTQVGEIPSGMRVFRAFALDTQRHLAIRGRYLRWTALPDRWVSWCLGAVPSGLFAIYRQRAQVILTTFPVATSLLIGLILHRLTGRPWLVDLRDSMTEEDYPRDPLTWRLYRWIERQMVRHGSRLIFTAPSTIRMYLERYPELRPEKCLLIPNGYDESDFRSLVPWELRDNHSGSPLYLLHMGVLYPEERDPDPFFQALRRLKTEGRVSAAQLRVGLRASGSEGYHADKIHQLGIEDLVELLPALPYHQALQEGAHADGLLLFQGASCDHQIPAKAYEYLRLRRPILALTTETGDTAALLKETRGATIVNMHDAGAIYRALPGFLDSLQRGEHQLPDADKVVQYSRSNQAQALARCLSQLICSQTRN